MNAHPVNLNGTYTTHAHGCNCPNFQKTGGGYIFHNFLTGETLVGCKHMFDLYMKQAQEYMTNQAQKMAHLAAHNEALEAKLKEVNGKRIAAEVALEAAQSEVRVLKRKQREMVGV